MFGSGRGAIRAVSFFGPSEVAEGGVGGEPGNFAAAGRSRGAVGLKTGRSGAGAGGEGEALGGNGVGAVETGGSEGANGGRGGGRLIRTVSRDSLLAPGGVAAGGGKVMRTVSFLGSFESAMKIWRVGPESCAKIRYLSLVNLVFTAKAA